MSLVSPTTGPRRRSRPRASEQRTLRSPVARRRRGGRAAGAALVAATLTVLAVVSLGPLLWLAKASVSTTQDLLREPLALWPSGARWDNLAQAWGQGQVGRHLATTAAVAGGSLVVTLVVAVTAAYVIAVLRPRWAPLLTGGLVATLLVPGVALLVPRYLTVADVPLLGLDLRDSYWAVWLPAGADAFVVLVLARYFASLPRELFEAARVDGAGPFRVLVQVVLPLSGPGLTVVSLLTVVTAWKDFLWPSLVLLDPSLQPVAVALPRLLAPLPLAEQMAALFLAALVPVLLFVLLQRHFFAAAGASGGTSR